MEYAVIETGGKQYKVKKGDVLDIDSLPESKNGTVAFDKTLLYVNGSDVKIGKPFLANLKVHAKIITNLKGEKIRVARFKAKSKYRKVTGFRAFLTRIQIDKIEKKPS